MSDKRVKDTALLKEAALFLGWIAGLVLLAGLLWFLTQPIRSRFLLRAVNQKLEQSGDFRRLGEPVFSRAPPGMGFWYTMTGLSSRQAGDGRVFVFTFIGEGTFFPCAAVLGPSGVVEEFIPLNAHGERLFRRISPEILKLHARRIEGFTI